MCGFECGNGFSFVNTTIYNPPRPRPALGPPDKQTNLYENSLVIVEQLTKKKWLIQKLTLPSTAATATRRCFRTPSASSPPSSRR